MNDTLYWLWLSIIFGPASRKLWKIMNFTETASEAYYELRTGTFNSLLEEKHIQKISDTPLQIAESMSEECRKRNIGILTYTDSRYPVSLRYIATPPAVLYYKGTPDCLANTRAVAAVGTRNAGSYALDVTEKVCRELALKNILVISGFAVGVDITAHLAAVSANKPTVCVMGCGVDVNYPKENFANRDKVIAANGVFISEYPPGTQPYPSNFPVRNRILAALSQAAIVFEASAKSGSLITARLAAEQGREVFVLPPADILGKAFSGNSELLRSGASPLMDINDILNFFRSGSPVDSAVKADAFARIRTSMSAGTHNTGINIGALLGVGKGSINLNIAVRPAAGIDDLGGPADRKAAPKEKAKKDAPKKKKAPDLSQFSGIKAEILSILAEKGATHADEICTAVNADTSDVMTELTDLEIEGIIKEVSGRIYEIC